MAMHNIAYQIILVLHKENCYSKFRVGLGSFQVAVCQNWCFGILFF